MRTLPTSPDPTWQPRLVALDVDGTLPSWAEVEGTVACGDPRDLVVKVAAEKKAGLIVVGTHGRRGLRRALLGSVAESVVRDAACPVLVVR